MKQYQQMKVDRMEDGIYYDPVNNIIIEVEKTNRKDVPYTHTIIIGCKIEHLIIIHKNIKPLFKHWVYLGKIDS